MAGKLNLVFYKEGGTVCHDGQPLIKGLPALLLAHMLRNHGQTGKTVYFLKELRVAAHALGSGDNLEARLERLSQRLRERLPSLRLIRKKGYRILEIDGSLEWIEQ